MKVAAFYKILLLILLLGFGRSTMDTARFPQGIDIAFDYGVDTDNHRNYGVIPAQLPILFHERIPELPFVSKLKSNSGLLGINLNKDLYLLNRESFIPKYNGEHITVGLDSRAIIFPFHTFF